jgi:hypothetical protein
MPVESLSDEQAAAYGWFDEAPVRAELERFFFLDDADRGLLRKPKLCEKKRFISRQDDERLS